MDADLYTDDFEKASEYLRLALTLLSKHKIPPSPSNFRIGYEAIAGKNDELKTKFAKIISQQQESPADSLHQLYKNIFVQDEESLDAMRQEIRQAVSSGRLKDHTNNESYGRVTVSVGITQFAMNDIAETIVRRADRALYLAKDRGRNRVEKAIENLQSSTVSS